MKALFLLLLLVPLRISAQTDTTLLPPLATFRADTLKPIVMREVPYQYYVKGGSRTGFNRVYTYDGIDVDKPVETLTPTIRAVHDLDADRELEALAISLQKRNTAKTWLITLESAGFISLIVSAAQASAYKQGLNDKIKNYYHSPGSLSTPPTTVDQPNGDGFGFTGLGLMVLGLAVGLPNLSPRTDHFHRAVQYYNRALSHKVSWRLEPYSVYGQSGLTLRGWF